MIRIIPIETGKARMKTAQKTGREGRGPLGRKIDIFRDPNWIEPVPILCFLVEHRTAAFSLILATLGAIRCRATFQAGTPSISRCPSGSRRCRK
jgi:hypothetical protein